MKRREFCKFQSLGVAASLAGVAGSLPDNLFAAAVAPKSKRPNIILILADDAGWGDFGFHGSDIKTPNLDKLCSSGVELENFYAYPVCTPTRAALLTGKPPSRYGLTTAIAADAEHPLPRDIITVAEVLRRGGYDTAMTGKWHLGNSLDYGPSTYGFNHSHGFLGPWIDFYSHKTQKDKIDWHRDGEFIEEKGHSTDLITNEAVNFIKSKRDKDKPFFLYTAFNAPHLPLQEEDRWLDMYRDKDIPESRLFYMAMVSHLDFGVGQILKALEDEKLLDDTLIIFFSDNGAESPGKKGYLGPIPTYRTTQSIDGYGENKPLKGWKASFYEGGIKVPAIMNWRGKLKPWKCDAPAIVYDIFPTLAGIAGQKIPESVNTEGKDIWQSVSKGAVSGERIFYWRLTGAMAVRKGDWKLIHKGKDLSAGADELYNIKTDPLEKNEVSAKNPGVLEEMLKELKKQFSLDSV